MSYSVRFFICKRPICLLYFIIECVLPIMQNKIMMVQMSWASNHPERPVDKSVFTIDMFNSQKKRKKHPPLKKKILRGFFLFLLIL